LRYSYQSSENTPVWVLISVNLVIFILTIFDHTFTSFPYTPLHNNLALSLNTFGHWPWIIITSMFAHSGIWHIFSNMLGLFFFGTFLIQLIGTNRFLITYFVGGIIGSLFFLLFAYLGIDATPSTYIIGASGAVYALGATLAVLTPKLRVYFFSIVPLPLWVAIVIGLIIILPGVAWQAHLGGAAAGALAGLYFRRQNLRYRIR
jgi:uncharacterized protein